MRRGLRARFLVQVVASCLSAAFGASAVAQTGSPPKRDAEFWSVQRRGANDFSAVPSRERFEAAAKAGIEFLRVAPDKWPAAGRDFLIGDADAFDGVNQTDLDLLRRALDDAHAAGMPVVLTMLSLPGCRWRQHNGGEDDLRLWTDPAYREQAVAFWRELAGALRDHPAIVAYNPLNEPRPGHAYAVEDAESDEFQAWLREHKGGPGDLNAFNRAIVEAIRSVDPDTPIMLDGFADASPAGLARLEPVDDPGVLYAFHFYQPWRYCSARANRGRFSYPDAMPRGWGNDETVAWPAGALAERMAPVVAWAERYRVPTSRIVMSEVGVDRLAGGAAAYLTDALDEANANGWHWAFYAFREDVWNRFDYEVGPVEIDLSNDNTNSDGRRTEPARGPNPIWAVIQASLAAPRR